ncbi:hypothetical protein SAMN05444267_10189 [Chryseobacterium polytrichastri]|uniref:Uncharacterized protein n=1 Tax=Chryseobacterium polytrichastri TaxID=1302687 RepID=A0A1M7AP25_9FLAO|nr:hypothetical protein SAMN05444267_10189 [Chryseobacterium polytrichastri]
MQYKIVFSKNSTDIVDSSGSIILKTVCKTYFFKRKYFVYDSADNLLLVFQKTDFLLIFLKTKILLNNLNHIFEYKEKGLSYFLLINRITLKFKGQVIGLLNSEFKVNNTIVGHVKEIPDSINNSMIFNFPEDNEINQYCLILFTIASTNYWDPH